MTFSPMHSYLRLNVINYSHSCSLDMGMETRSGRLHILHICLHRASLRIDGLKLEAPAAKGVRVGQTATRAGANMRTRRDDEASQGPEGERAGKEAC